MACRGVTDPDVAQGGGVPRLHLAQGGGVPRLHLAQGGGVPKGRCCAVRAALKNRSSKNDKK